MPRFGLSDLDAVMAIARKGSFRAAAVDLGVSTTALGLTLNWHRPVLLVDADPTGSSSVFAGYFHGTQEPTGGLITLALALREGTLAAALPRETLLLNPEAPAPASHQPSAVTAASTTTAGTNHAEIRSTRRCVRAVARTRATSRSRWSPASSKRSCSANDVMRDPSRSTTSTGSATSAARVAPTTAS